MSDELQTFYAERSEEERLLHGIGQLEVVRTRELLTEILPAGPAVIYDVGGGTGHHAGWLAEQGHTVHLLDPVRDHVERAATNHRSLASAQIGDARGLPWPDCSGDVVLLMGPLYHLAERHDRLKALQEARRVVTQNGILFAVIIPRWASALVGMIRGWTYDSTYASMVREELITGVHRRPSTWPRLFMDGFFHSRTDIEAEVSAAGFELEGCRSIEGPAWLSEDFDASWRDAAKRLRILELSRHAENDPDMFGASPHIAVVCRPAG
jgi:SAM-dependent methyltransferase